MPFKIPLVMRGTGNMYSAENVWGWSCSLSDFVCITGDHLGHY